MNAIEEFRNALAGRGIVAPAEIIGDGKLRRCDAEGHNGNGDAAYLLHLDGIPAGGFQNHRDGLGWENWRAKLARPLTVDEQRDCQARIEATRRERRADEVRRRAEALDRAAAIWKAAPVADDDHAYLVRKGVKAHRLRLHRGLLVIPMRDTEGTLHSLQFIAPKKPAEGSDKHYLTGGRVAACYFSIGAPGDRICIAEGYATGATIHEATGIPVAVAFHAGNLRAVAEAVKAKLPTATLIICADDDYRTAGNPGITHATEAARAVGGLLAVPDFGADRPEGATDFNDLAAHRGREAVQRAIADARSPDASGAPAIESNATAGDSDGPRVRLIRGDSIEPEPVRGLWEGWLARGKLHVLAGRPGTGKTTLAVSLAATISIGGRWPDGSHTEPGNALIWSGEDDPKDTLVPRLIANGADMSRVFFVGDSLDAEGRSGSFDPARHMTELELAAVRIGGVRLLIVDPVVSAVSGDGNSNTEVRRALQPIVDLAARLDCAALGISHFTKGSDGRDVVERVTGSLAFGAAARIVLAAAKLKGEDERAAGRIVARAKSNIGPDSGGFGYDLEQVELPDYPGVVASRVLWAQAIEGTARELLREAEAEDEADGGDPRQFLAELLANGPLKATEVFRAAEAHGYSKRQMQRACKRLGIKAAKQGMAGGWVWALTEGATRAGDDPEDVEDSAFSCLAPSAPWAGTFGAEDTASDAKTPEDPGHKKAAPSASSASSAPSARDWRVTRASGESFMTRTTPPATLAEMREQYPGATIESLNT